MREARTVWVVGFGMGPDHLTREATTALAAADVVVAFRKGADDPLLEVRRTICAEHDLRLVEVDDPSRDRDDPANYGAAVADWHAARASALAEVLEREPGTPALLVWGDPALYDSTLRLLDAVAASQPLDVRVVAGISAPQLLAARHRIVLHEVGQPLHVTTARRLREAVAAGQRNVCVMLGSAPDWGGLEDWQVWWGANLGTPSERLVSGSVGEVLADVVAARAAARAEAGWVMDVSLLRAPRED
ncbi:MAG: precorrin-6A synthase (deacetylating) [Nocardioides sp.]|uniref:precorrin-6A synthase (deacetylating) n=1 Tax=Nocardioides sp. TaxID=35761 RepID=UPI003F0F7BD5